MLGLEFVQTAGKNLMETTASTVLKVKNDELYAYFIVDIGYIYA